MGAAVAVHETAGPPGWVEKILVLGICAGLFMGLATLDDRAARREAARAHEVLAERAQRAAERSSRESMTAPTAVPGRARTDGLGREADPIVIPSGPVGLATSVVSREDTPAAEIDATQSPRTVLHRVEGPRAPRVTSAIPQPDLGAPVTVRTTPVVAGTARSNDEILLLLLMGALGVSMIGGGLRLLSLRSA